jgi:hypothetical protein
MDRRTALAAAGGAASALLAGCIDTARSVVGSSDDEPSDDEPSDDEPNDDETGTHHFYLVNLDDESRRVDLEIGRRDGNETVVAGTYEIPDERGAEFRDVAAWEETYEVTATLASGLSETFAWETDPCPGPEAEDDASELPDGSRNAAVRIDPGAEALSFVADNCDEIIAGTEVSTGGADRFEVEESD